MLTTKMTTNQINQVFASLNLETAEKRDQYTKIHTSTQSIMKKPEVQQNTFKLTHNTSSLV
ncbi:hypothetical protein NST92_05480 [Bacillus sp. FSL R5-0586]|uniref:hypothetical protein n=1 Tax=Bacillus TaxID=1386 RepID=UPI0002E141B2|nr:hypothetical protein [Bacillus altitudinis]PYH25681.1 hypothetical protein US8_03484 [Bacillus altitudinis]